MDPSLVDDGGPSRLPSPAVVVGRLCLNKNEVCGFHQATHGAICLSKTREPIIGVSRGCVFGTRQIIVGCRRSSAVHYSQRRETVGLLTNTGQPQPFTKHPLNQVPILSCGEALLAHTSRGVVYLNFTGHPFGSSFSQARQISWTKLPGFKDRAQAEYTAVMCFTFWWKLPWHLQKN